MTTPTRPLGPLFEGYVAPRPDPSWTPEKRRDVGKAIAAANNRHQRTRARVAALECLGLRGPSTISHVRVWCQERKIELEWEKPWTGSLFQHPWFEATGRLKNAFHEGSNARRVMVWQLSAEGRRAFQEGNTF